MPCGCDCVRVCQNRGKWVGSFWFPFRSPTPQKKRHTHTAKTKNTQTGAIKRTPFFDIMCHLWHRQVRSRIFRSLPAGGIVGSGTAECWGRMALCMASPATPAVCIRKAACFGVGALGGGVISRRNPLILRGNAWETTCFEGFPCNLRRKGARGRQNLQAGGVLKVVPETGEAESFR